MKNQIEKVKSVILILLMIGYVCVTAVLLEVENDLRILEKRVQLDNFVDKPIREHFYGDVKKRLEKINETK